MWEAARAEPTPCPFVRAAEREALSERLEVAFAAAFCDGNLQAARSASSSAARTRVAATSVLQAAVRRRDRRSSAGSTRT